MASNYTEWSINLVDLRTNRPISDSTGKMQVLTASSPLKATIYSDSVGTSMTNPGTFANGVVRFFTDSSVTSVDLSIMTANGHAFFLSGITPSLQKCLVNPDKIEQTAIIAWYVTASGVVADTGMKFPSNVVIKDAYLRVAQPCSAATIDVGCSTTVTGYLVGCTTEVTGFRIIDEGSTTLGARGTLLNNAITATQQNFLKRAVPANATSALTIVYQMVTAATAAGGGYVYLVYDRNPANG